LLLENNLLFSFFKKPKKTLKKHEKKTKNGQKYPILDFGFQKKKRFFLDI